MKLDLTGKVAVVSGSTSGIGQGIAAGLAKAGATVVVVGRKQSGVDDAMAAIAAQTPTASLRGVVADLSTEDGVTALIAAVPTADVLVNNLGIFNDKDFFSVPDDEWMHFYNVNVLSGVRLARHYAPGMTEQGWGRIIFVSSESGVAIPGDMINYGVTKAANLAVSHGLAKRLAGTGVTVNAILPGPTFTDGLKEMLPLRSRDAVRVNRPMSLLKPRVRAPSSSVRQMWKKWRIWRFISRHRFPRQPQGQPCASMAASSTP